MSCLICENDDTVRHVNLYISGSEGLWICHQCEMVVVTHIRDMRLIAGTVKLRTIQTQKNGAI
jgi:ribosomal protein L37AE/L43A